MILFSLIWVQVIEYMHKSAFRDYLIAVFVCYMSYYVYNISHLPICCNIRFNEYSSFTKTSLGFEP